MGYPVFGADLAIYNGLGEIAALVEVKGIRDTKPNWATEVRARMSGKLPKTASSPGALVEAIASVGKRQPETGVSDHHASGSNLLGGSVCTRRRGLLDLPPNR